MRVYLKESVDVVNILESGAAQTVSYPSAGFYNAPAELGRDWIEKGLAFAATDDNRVIAYAGNAEVRVDFDAGHKLAPEHLTKPAPIVEPDPPNASTAPDEEALEAAAESPSATGVI